jgi:hypothetical protein
MSQIKNACYLIKNQFPKIFYGQDFRGRPASDFSESDGQWITRLFEDQEDHALTLKEAYRDWVSIDKDSDSPDICYSSFVKKSKSKFL